MISLKLCIFYFQISLFVNAIGNSIDPSTYANIEEVRSTHLSLDLNVDFNTTTLSGSIVHNMTIMADNVQSVFFDSVSLNISRVQFVTEDISTDMNYTISFPNSNLGGAVEVYFAETLPKGHQIQIKIDFANNTDAGNTAISWLTKEQTAGKNMRYLYS